MDATSAAAQELRAAFEKARETGTAQGARAAAVRYYRHRATQGGTQATAAQELGINQSTLSKWHQRDVSGVSARESATPRPRELDSEGAALRAEVQGLGPKTPSRRFPEELKQRIVRWVETQRAAGAGAGELEEALGIPWTSVSKWMRGKAPVGPSPSFRPVAVVQTRSTPRPILKTPGGFVVEGLDVEGLAALLKALG